MVDRKQTQKQNETALHIPDEHLGNAKAKNAVENNLLSFSDDDSENRPLLRKSKTNNNNNNHSTNNNNFIINSTNSTNSDPVLKRPLSSKRVVHFHSKRRSKRRSKHRMDRRKREGPTGYESNSSTL